MKVQGNKTKYPARFITRMVKWCIKELNVVPDCVDIVHPIQSRTRATGVFYTRKPAETKWSNNGGRFTTKLQPSQLCIAFPPGTLYDKAHVFPVVCYIGAAIRPSLVPDGELGLYRQPIGLAFSEKADELIAQWREGLPEPDDRPDKVVRTEDKLARARRQVKRWEAKRKLAETKLKIWRRRVRAAEKSLTVLQSP